MRIALLCPGPSLKKTYSYTTRHFDAVVAVNKAARGYDCDWWVFQDELAFWKWRPRGLPCCLVADIVHHRLAQDDRSRFRWPQHEHMICTELAELVQPPRGWCSYSSLPALALCLYLGADFVHVYGADMEGTTDYTGQPGGNRDPKRWAQERLLWDRMVAWLYGHRCRVVRHLPLGNPDAGKTGR